MEIEKFHVLKGISKGRLSALLYQRLIQRVKDQKPRKNLFFRLRFKNGKINRLLIWNSPTKNYLEAKVFVKNDMLFIQCNKWGKNIFNADIFFPGINDIEL